MALQREQQEDFEPVVAQSRHVVVSHFPFKMTLAYSLFDSGWYEFIGSILSWALVFAAQWKASGKTGNKKFSTFSGLDSAHIKV